VTVSATYSSLDVRFGTPAGRSVLVATVLGSSLASVDGTVVGIALPRIGADLHASFAGLQWTVTAYTLTLASFILVGGGLGDRWGRRRLFVLGAVWFTVASLGCALAPSVELLVAGRALQGVGGALLTPASLAIIEASFVPSDRSRAVGAWAGASGVAGALAPFAGGWILAVASWRWVFLVNVPLAALVVLLARHVPETRDLGSLRGADLRGALLAVLGLGALTYGIIETRPLVAVGGAVALALLPIAERRAPTPLLPIDLFRRPQFVAANLVTFLAYAAIGAFFFLLVLALQVVAGWSPLAAGTSVLPVTVLTLLLSSRSGALAQRIGPRLQMGLGPLLCAGGCLLTTRIDAATSYPVDVFPAVALFGLGLAVMVAPLTATALSSAPPGRAGIASGVNNAVARAGTLLAIATIPVATGLTDASYRSAEAFRNGYVLSACVCAGLLALSGAVAALLVRNPHLAIRPAVHPPEGETA
jgi:EmrB/QacA subfamily drug resistance transporter